MTDETTLASLVHHAVSSANELVAGFDVILKQPQEIYSMPKVTLEAIRTILEMNSKLTQRLFEENQNIGDEITRIMSKLKKK
jgi:hypothetical protein